MSYTNSHYLHIHCDHSFFLVSVSLFVISAFLQKHFMSVIVINEHVIIILFFGGRDIDA